MMFQLIRAMDAAHNYIYYRLKNCGPSHILEIWELYPSNYPAANSSFVYHLKFQVQSPSQGWQLLNEHLQVMTVPPIAYDAFQAEGGKVWVSATP